MKQASFDDWLLKLEVSLETQGGFKRLNEFDQAEMTTAWKLGRTPEAFLREQTEAQTSGKLWWINESNQAKYRPNQGCQERKCPMCREAVLAVAFRCKHCGAKSDTSTIRRRTAPTLTLETVIFSAIDCFYVLKKTDESNVNFLENLNGLSGTDSSLKPNIPGSATTPVQERIAPEQTEEYVLSVGRTLAIKQRVAAAVNHANDLDSRGLYREAAQVRHDARIAWEAEKARVARDEAKFNAQDVLP